jgi:methylmalonyl-CoA mutase cobalamin-binding subunit
MSMPRYPIRAVARLTGLPLDTLRAWERRYEAVVPERGPRGRQYTEAQVERLRLLKEAVEQGHAIGVVARQDTTPLRALVAAGRAVPTRQAPEGDYDRLAPIVAAIEALDPGEIDGQLGRLGLMLPPRAFVHEIVVPLMRETGARWHQGRFSVAQEHLLSAVMRNLLGTLIRLHAPAGVKPSIVFSTPEGELHEFGILAAAMLASVAGLGVLYLGPNLPAPEIVSSAARVGARVVTIGLTPANHRDPVLEDVSWLARRLPATTELWIGGGNGYKVSGRRGGAPVTWLKSLSDFEDALARLG